MTIPPIALFALPTLAVDMLLVARADAPAGQVRAVTETIYSLGFVRGAGLSGLTEAHGRQVRDTALHTAAARYYSRNDPITSDRFEIASFFIAALVLGASVAQYLVSRRRRIVIEQRRQAIVPYFESMVTFGNAVENSNDPDQLVSILHSMMANHRRAEEDWLRGELDTEHMENLYSVYNIRSRNAFHKIFKLRLSELQEQNRDLKLLLTKQFGEPAKAPEKKPLPQAAAPRARVAPPPPPKPEPKAEAKPAPRTTTSNTGAPKKKADEDLPEIVMPPDK